MSSAIYLRTLSRLSEYKFNGWDNYSMKQLLNEKRYMYLRLMYYNRKEINYTEDVLKELGIFTMQINKPGINNKMATEVKNYFSKLEPENIKEVKKETKEYNRMLKTRCIERRYR